MIALVKNRGKNNGTINSLNVIVTTQIIAMLITIEKSPRVIISKGNANVFKTGFTKKFKSPKIIPNNKNNCQYWAMPTPKNSEFGNNSIFTPGIINVASHRPKPAAIICERSFLMLSIY